MKIGTPTCRLLQLRYVSISIAIAYTSPFLGAFLADSFLGEYLTIIMGIVCSSRPCFDRNDDSSWFAW
jgi:hypothetical protein